MRFPFFDVPPDEPSRSVGFAGNVIERLSEKRADDAAMRALDDPLARLMLLRDGRVQMRQDGAGFQAYHDRASAAALGAAFEGAVLLGHADGRPVLAVPGGLDAEALPVEVKAIDYRSVYMQGLLSPADLGALAQGAALLSWHASHAFCSRCGHASEMRAGGIKRRCPACGTEHFPRTDPVAIMLALDGDRCLLGRSPHFAPGMFSALAGFIEPGETIEDAVRRETLEEAGVRLGRVVYHASQPWPFPHSLMIGCYGEALSTEVGMDSELEACRWFGRDEVLTALDGTHADGIRTPPRGAIAHSLIRRWAEAER
ncbi:MAG: NAD(+) diphosphatase [Mesorhizobium sp.]